MTISALVAARGITELVHFTTNSGILGILMERAVMARTRLVDNYALEHIYKANCPNRSRDVKWHGHVSLSISRINPDLFRSSGHWHEGEGWWCVLSISPSILTDESVVFSTTNNMYSGTRRASGPAGFEALFAPRIHRYNDLYVDRPADLEARFATCRYAEALYPVDIPISRIQRIYVSHEDHHDALQAMFGALEVIPIPCEICPDAFR